MAIGGPGGPDDLAQCIDEDRSQNRPQERPSPPKMAMTSMASLMTILKTSDASI